MELILNTFGTSLGKEGENFVIIHKDGRQLLHTEGINSILISKGAQISSDAAIMAIQKEIDVLFVDTSGKPIGRIWGSKFGSVSTIRRKQVDFTFSEKAVKWIKEAIAHKVDNQQAMLMALSPAEEKIAKEFQQAMVKLEDYKRKIRSVEATIISDIAPTLRGWEGISSKIYFEGINKILPEKYKTLGRSQHPAKDIFNCLLNYGYGMLYGKVEGALIKAGLDPYVGVFHRDDYNRPVLVYDVIELYRIWIDYVVINLCIQHAIDENSFSIKEDGSYWLENLGRRILIQSVNDYLDEIINLKGIERSRATHIELDAHAFAQKILNS